MNIRCQGVWTLKQLPLPLPLLFTCLASVAPQPVGGPIEPTNFVGGDWMNVFVDLAAPTAGTIAAWSFYAMNTGEFYAAVWRPLGSWNFRIIGKNKLAIDTLGKQVSS